MFMVFARSSCTIYIGYLSLLLSLIDNQEKWRATLCLWSSLPHYPFFLYLSQPITSFFSLTSLHINPTFLLFLSLFLSPNSLKLSLMETGRAEGKRTLRYKDAEEDEDEEDEDT